MGAIHALPVRKLVKGSPSFLSRSLKVGRRIRRGYWLALAGALALGIWRPAQVAIVDGHSMEPTLRAGRVVLIDRRHYRFHPIRRGEVVAFKHGGVTQIKRVYGMPGDRIWELHLDDDSLVLLVPRSRLDYARVVAQQNATVRIKARHVPPDAFYMLGDNAGISRDSRQCGTIPKEAVLGRVILNEQGAREFLQAVKRATIVPRQRRQRRAVATR